MMTGTGYQEYTNSALEGNRNLQPQRPSDLQTASGVALSGAMIFNGLAAGNLDAVQNEWVTLDECLTHPTPFG